MEEGLPTGSETILVVDDEEDVRHSTSALLEKLGYKVLQTGTPDQAIHLITLSNVHLVLMDVVLPGMSGLSLAEKLADIRPSIRILYFSGYTSDQILDEQEAAAAGVAFLEKPYTVEELASAVRDLLDEDIPLPPPKDSAPRGTEAILVVEDDHATRRSMVKSLEKLGYQVLEAHYPDRALTIAANSKVDLVVMDVFLPGMSGLALARTMHTAKPWIRYLFISGMAPEELVQEGSPVPGKTHFLEKPFGPVELGGAVREALDAPQPSD